MAIYHFSSQIISRSKGSSSVASSAYRAGEKIQDERTGLEHDYTKKTGIEYTEILTPSKVPSWATDRSRIWNEVEAAEKRKDAQLSREINIALPKELNKDQQIELVKDFVKDTFVDKGMVADISIHDMGKGNPHAHIMLTMRAISEDGFGKKNREWNKKENLEEWREKWGEYANKSLARYGFEERIDHRSFKDQGIDLIPQIHVGVHASAMEKKGISTERGSLNNKIKELNNELRNIEKEKVVALDEFKEIKSKLDEAKKEQVERYDNLPGKTREDLEKADKFINGNLDFKNAAATKNKLMNVRELNIQEINSIDKSIDTLKSKITSINNALESQERYSKTLKNLPKGILGGYKDKSHAEMLKSNIERSMAFLKSEGSTTKVEENKILELNYKRKSLENNINKIDQGLKILDKGVEALKISEGIKFIDKHIKEFPQAKYLSYEGIKAIEKVQNATKLQSIKEIVKAYQKSFNRLEEVNNKLNGIESTSKRLDNAEKCLKTMDKHQGIIDKWDKGLFKSRFQDKHRTEKYEYDTAISNLTRYGVKDRADFINQIRSFEKTSSLEPNLIQERNSLTNIVNVLESGVAAIKNALARASIEMRKQEAKQRSLEKSRSMSKEFGIER